MRIFAKVLKLYQGTTQTSTFQGLPFFGATVTALLPVTGNQRLDLCRRHTSAQRLSQIDARSGIEA
jgi:hypothetical protein